MAFLILGLLSHFNLVFPSLFFFLKLLLELFVTNYLTEISLNGKILGHKVASQVPPAARGRGTRGCFNSAYGAFVGGNFGRRIHLLLYWTQGQRELEVLICSTFLASSSLAPCVYVKNKGASLSWSCSYLSRIYSSPF